MAAITLRSELLGRGLLFALLPAGGDCNAGQRHGWRRNGQWHAGRVVRSDPIQPEGVAALERGRPEPEIAALCADRMHMPLRAPVAVHARHLADAVIGQVGMIMDSSEKAGRPARSSSSKHSSRLSPTCAQPKRIWRCQRRLFASERAQK